MEVRTRKITLNLKTADYGNLLDALKVFNNGRKVEVGAGEKLKVETVPYDLSGAIVPIAQNLNILATEHQSLMETYNAMIKAVSGGGKQVPDELMDEFTRDWAEVLSETKELELYRIKLSTLNISKNRIPPGVISVLWPLIIDDETVEETE